MSKFPCRHCKGTGYLRASPPMPFTMEVKRMAYLMEKYNLTTYSLSEILNVHQSTISSWFSSKRFSGKINPKYFITLENKGYK